MVLLFTHDADDFHKCKKVISDKIKVEHTGKSVYFRVPVYTEMGEPLMLRVQFYKKYSFTLLYRNKYPIRRWDFKHTGGVKENAQGKKILIPHNKGHKHRWNEKSMDKDFYVVNDIPTNDFRKAFFAFLKEENITFKGEFLGMPMLGGF